MPAYRGKNVVVEFGATPVDISGDGRSVSFEQNADILDDTTYGDDNKTKQAGLLDGTGSFEALDTTGDWSGVWEAIAPGVSDTMIVYPEGKTVGNRKSSFTAVIKSRSLDMPYEDLAKVSMSFEISGAVTEATVTA